MFEGMVADLLNKNLDWLVEGIDKESISAAVLAGSIELKNLRIKASAFDALGIPVTLAGGVVGLIRIDIPWKSIATGWKSNPIVVKLDTVIACLRPSSEYEERTDTSVKRAALAADEVRWQHASDRGCFDGAARRLRNGERHHLRLLR